MTTVHHCYCGAVAEIGYPAEEGLRWFCSAHAPWQCAGCGPETDEDRYPTLHDEDDEA
jgi:hypothetical protein